MHAGVLDFAGPWCLTAEAALQQVHASEVPCSAVCQRVAVRRPANSQQTRTERCEASKKQQVEATQTACSAVCQRVTISQHAKSNSATVKGVRPAKALLRSKSGLATSPAASFCYAILISFEWNPHAYAPVTSAAVTGKTLTCWSAAAAAAACVCCSRCCC
jgi:hypothetical protein